MWLRLALALFLTPNLASAIAGCYCLSTECDEPLEGDAVFVGVVTDNGTSVINQLIVDLKSFFGNEAPRRVEMDVLETLRGPHLLQREIFTTWKECGTLLEVGRRYLVYTEHSEETGQHHTSTCRGTRLLGNGPDGRLEFLRAARRGSANTMIVGRIFLRVSAGPGTLQKLPAERVEAAIELRLTSLRETRSVFADRTGHFLFFPLAPGGRFNLAAFSAGLRFAGIPFIVEVARGCQFVPVAAIPDPSMPTPCRPGLKGSCYNTALTDVAPSLGGPVGKDALAVYAERCQALPILCPGTPTYQPAR